jgi:hypothetical protein
MSNQRRDESALPLQQCSRGTTADCCLPREYSGNASPLALQGSQIATASNTQAVLPVQSSVIQYCNSLWNTGTTEPATTKTSRGNVRFVGFTVVTMENAIIWDVTSCGSYKNQGLRGTYNLHHQGGKNQRALAVASN